MRLGGGKEPVEESTDFLRDLARLEGRPHLFLNLRTVEGRGDEMR